MWYIMCVGYTREETEAAVAVLSSLLSKCKKAKEKLTEGTAQYTLTVNRIKALEVALAAMADKTTPSAAEAAATPP